jgi:hypothetical protein
MGEMNTGFTGPRNCWAHAFPLAHVWLQRKGGIECGLLIYSYYLATGGCEVALMLVFRDNRS